MGSWMVNLVACYSDTIEKNNNREQFGPKPGKEEKKPEKTQNSESKVPQNLVCLASLNFHKYLFTRIFLFIHFTRPELEKN